MLADSVSASSIGKRVVNGCEFHWLPPKDNNKGSCKLLRPDGKEIIFEVDEHDVPYLMEHRETIAVPANMNTPPKPVLKPEGAPVERPTDGPFELINEPTATDYSEDDAEEEHTLRKRGDKDFLMNEAKSLTRLCTHLPKNPYCTSCMRSQGNQQQKRRRGHKKHHI